MQCQQLPYQRSGCGIQAKRCTVSKNVRRFHCTAASTDPLLLRVARGEGNTVERVRGPAVLQQAAHDLL